MRGLRIRVWLIVAAVVISASITVAKADTWMRVFEGPDYGAFFDLVLTASGHVLAVGATNHLHVGPYSGDALLMKLTLAGDTLWETSWGGEGYEQALSAVQAEDGGFLIFGETDSHGAGDRDFFLLKITGEGAEEWFKTYGGSRREWPYGVISLAGGDVLMYGFTTTDGGIRRQYAVRATSAGDVVWEYLAGEANEELILDALVTPAGDLILCVCIDEDGGLVKLSPGGDVIWS